MATLRWHAALLAAAILAGSASHLPAQTNENAAVEMFAAIEAGQITVEVIPRDATRLTMIVSNETDQPLTIQLPGAALAQFFPQPGGGGANPNGGSNSPQGLGIGFQANQNVGQQPFGNLFGQQQAFQGGGFNVPAGRTIRARVPCVCLEYGKPEPTPHHPYEIRPLTTFSDDLHLAALLELTSYGNYTQREVQLASWHLTDDIAWDDFEKQRIEHLNGTSERAYSDREIQRAKDLVESLDAEIISSEPAASETLSPGELSQNTSAEVAH